jgi:hypothetical protein
MIRCKLCDDLATDGRFCTSCVDFQALLILAKRVARMTNTDYETVLRLTRGDARSDLDRKVKRL